MTTTPPAPQAAHPFDALTPDTVLNGLQPMGLTGDGRLLPLNSYENRVYQVGLVEGPTIVVKFYRPGRWSDAQILEEHAFTRELAAEEIPVVAPLAIDGRTLHEFGGFRFAVYPRRGGRAPEFDRLDTLEWMGRFLGRIHAVGAVRPFLHGEQLDPARFGEASRAYLLEEGWIPAELRPAYETVSAEALAAVERCWERAGQPTLLRLHGDCHAGNVLWTEAGPHFVDFDDSRMGPAVQDLWMLLSGEREERARQLEAVLAGYETFRDFDGAELHLMEALRTLRLIHYSAWLAQRWTDPAFPRAFPWFGGHRYWQDRILELREQIALMQEPPLALLSGNR